MTEQEEEDKGKEKAHEKELKEELQATKEELRKAYEDLDGLRHGNEKNYNTMWNLRDITYEDNTEIKYNKINWT